MIPQLGQLQEIATRHVDLLVLYLHRVHILEIKHLLGNVFVIEIIIQTGIHYSQDTIMIAKEEILGFVLIFPSENFVSDPSLDPIVAISNFSETTIPHIDHHRHYG